jgi:hypothetical protein
MSSPAVNQAETEFDDLLGQLVDELAMTPPSESAVQLVPDPPLVSEVRVDSTHHLAAEAAEAAAAARARVVPDQTNNLVKIVGIIAGSLTVVAVAALILFARQSSESAEQDAAMAIERANEERLAEVARAEQAALERAEAERIAAERAAIEARKAQTEAKLLADEARTVESKPEPVKAQAKPKAKPKPKPAAKPTAAKPKTGDSFDDL